MGGQRHRQATNLVPTWYPHRSFTAQRPRKQKRLVGGIRTRDLRVMSPTSYLTAPPRGGQGMVATSRWPRWGGWACAGGFAGGASPRVPAHVSGAHKGSRSSTSAPTRRGCWSPTSPTAGGLAGRAAQPGDAAGPRRRPLGTALGRGDRGRLRGDRRLRRSCKTWMPAPRVDAIATSAVRDAANGERLHRRAARAVRALGPGPRRRGGGAPDLPRRHLRAPPRRATLVIDIGGGSTELIVGTGAEISFHASLQAGVVRHTERHIASDPRPRSSSRRSPPTSAG